MKRKFSLTSLFSHTAVLLVCSLPLAAMATPTPDAVIQPLEDVPVAGRVLGPDGTGLPGVTVLVRGTTNGTSTNGDGAFTLKAPVGSTLTFSYVGYVTQSIAVLATGNDALKVSLQEDVKQLNEVVVVGYGTQQREDVTGAVASVSGKDIASQPVADATQAIQGRAAGVTVTQNSGAPGGAGGTAVRIRGITSAGNNAPLYVVDGYPLASGDESQLNSINPNDIESMDVLKDASATAIYGVRAANGVVIITTKHGKTGKASINFDAYRGLQTVWRHQDLLNAQQYATINNENHIAAGTQLLDKLRDPSTLGAGTDWQKAVFRPQAVIQSYTLSALGGTDKVHYAASAGYFQQDGTLNGSQFERFTLRLNGDVQLSKRVKIGNNLQFTSQNDRQLDTSNSEFGVLNNVLQAPPTVPVYHPDGTWYEPTKVDNYTEPNPVQQSLIAHTRAIRNRMLTTLYMEIEPVKDLRFRTNVGADLIFDNGSGFTPSAGPNSPRYSVSQGYSYNNYTPSYLIENTLTYDHTFAEKHHVTALLGQSAQEFQYSSLSAGRTVFLNPDLQNLNNGGTNANLSNGGIGINPITDRLASTFARVNYDFKAKYLLSATIRRDGSSAFAPGHEFGVFPGGSVGWRISEENFLRGNSVLSDLKLRAGYGRVGNPLNAGRFAYLATINTGITTVFGPGGSTGQGTVNNGAAPTRAINNNLQWENNVQSNIGVDVGLFNNRLSASVDLYTRHSPNLISAVPPPYVSGTYESVPTNAISAYNRGIDISLTSRNLVGDDKGFTWTTTLIFSAYRSRLDKLNTASAFNGLVDRNGTAIVRYDQGQAFGAFYGYVADGLIQTPEELQQLNNNAKTKTNDPTAVYQFTGTAPGDIKFKDVNGDGRITDADRTFIGNPNPKFTYGVTNTVGWMGFDLTLFLQGSQGNDIYDLNRVYTEGGLYGNGNSSTRVLGRWTGPGTSYDVPRAIAGDPNQNQRVSSYFIENGSYMRIKLLTLGYTLPNQLLHFVGGKSLRVYVTGQNLLTLTKYKGFDPEVGSTGVDRGIYPQSRVFLAGLNIGF